MAKTRKQKILENTLSIEDIVKEFRSYKSKKKKVSFLEEMKMLSLPYDINWDNLIACWSGKKPWPSYNYNKKNEKDENIMKDTVEVVQGIDDKPLTKDELEALI
tara:strand:+ start:370 stop:681 length:312 start_codon:yes stop_codon:yes gene_type:complete